jgi:methyl-accepting chemotaxis protein
MEDVRRAAIMAAKSMGTSVAEMSEAVTKMTVAAEAKSDALEQLNYAYQDIEKLSEAVRFPKPKSKYHK